MAGLVDLRTTRKFLRRFIGRRAVRVVGVVLLVVVILLFLVLNWYIAPTKPSQRKDLVLAVAQILGGTALLSGLYFTWRTLQVNREGQITERFTRAIDQLGATDENAKKLFEIRLGGIYALERIARESKEDYWPIIEILTAYVRHNARQGADLETSEWTQGAQGGSLSLRRFLFPPQTSKPSRPYYGGAPARLGMGSPSRSTSGNEPQGS